MPAASTQPRAGAALFREWQATLARPPTVRCVPVDLERDDLAEALRAAGFDPALPAAFSWLGAVG